MALFSNDLGVDLGTSHTLIYAPDRGVVVREPSVVALDKNTGKLLQVGSAARNMLGRTPGNVAALQPVQAGVISDQEMTVKMLEHLLGKAVRSTIFTPKPRIIISVPSGVSEVEERTMINAALEAGARRVYLIEKPLASALGAGLDLSGISGQMVVDIGAGTTDIAVLSMNAVANASSIRVAGDAFDEAIARYVHKKFNLVIGKTTAEDIKIQIGCVSPRPEDIGMTIKGRDAKTGMPRQAHILSSDVLDALSRTARQIADEVANVLDTSTPELVSDIFENGIVLTGGGSQIWGMAQLLNQRVGVPCTLADDPDSCVAYGCGKSLAWINRMNEGPINLARKRILRRRMDF